MEQGQHKPKEPWLAVVLSYFLAGVGQIYSGRMRRGIALVLAELAFYFLLIWSLLSPKCDILVTGGPLLALVALRIWNLFDAHKCARKTNTQDFETARKQDKDPWLALFLSRLIPGIGQIYIRKWFWGIVFIAVAAVLLVVGPKDPLLDAGLGAVFAAFACYHAYASAPVRRETSNRTIFIVAVAILCLSLLGSSTYLTKAHVVEAFALSADSMRPTLMRGDKILVRKTRSYAPRRGDVVVLRPRRHRDTVYVKRIAALPGETIEIRDGTIYIDKREVRCPALNNIEHQSAGSFGIESQPYTVPQNSVFVLGDNSANSQDSRHFGPIPQSDVIGRACKIYWPLDRRGPVE
ncbi:MAG: signal peptidase I [Phycisphaerales bacterium]|nr:MAG: signal peptidase I [Phycisphaerales bacterium]